MSALGWIFRWVPRVRFSLRTLVCLVLLCGGVMNVYWHWEPWLLQKDFGPIECENGLRPEETFYSNYVVFEPSGRRFALTNRGGPVTIVNAETLAIELIIKSSVCKCVFSDDGNYLLVAGMLNLPNDVPPRETPFLELYDSHSGKLLKHFDTPLPTEILYSRPNTAIDPKFFVDVVAWRDNREIVAVDIKDGKSIEPPKQAIEYFHQYAKLEPNLDFYSTFESNCSPNGSLILLSTGVITIFEAGTRKRICSIDKSLPYARPSNDGKRIITTSSDNTSYLYDTQTGQLVAMIGESYDGDFFGGYDGSFFPDGERIVTVWGTGTRVWYRRRPEYWWGIAWLWEFWAAVVLGSMFGWSVWKDRKTLGMR